MLKGNKGEVIVLVATFVITIVSDLVVAIIVGMIIHGIVTLINNKRNKTDLEIDTAIAE